MKLSLIHISKAIEASSKDFSHVRENLKKALLTLSEGAERVSARQLIFITNSTNPFKEPDSRNVFGGFPSRRKFEDLPQSSKDLVQNYLKQIKRPLDLSKFIVQTFPFETDDETERYKFVMQKVNDFIGALNGNFTYGLGKWLFDVWNENVERMINILKRDFSGNQIIIASIFNYNFETVNIIELSNRLIDVYKRQT